MKRCSTCFCYCLTHAHSHGSLIFTLMTMASVILPLDIGHFNFDCWPWRLHCLYLFIPTFARLAFQWFQELLSESRWKTVFGRRWFHIIVRRNCFESSYKEEYHFCGIMDNNQIDIYDMKFYHLRINQNINTRANQKVGNVCIKYRFFGKKTFCFSAESLRSIFIEVLRRGVCLSDDYISGA